MEGPISLRGRSLGRWRERVKDYMCERGATRRLVSCKEVVFEQVSRGGGCYTMATPLGDIHGSRERGIRAIGINSYTYKFDYHAKTVSILSDAVKSGLKDAALCLLEHCPPSSTLHQVIFRDK